MSTPARWSVEEFAKQLEKRLAPRAPPPPPPAPPPVDYPLPVGAEVPPAGAEVPPAGASDQVPVGEAVTTAELGELRRAAALLTSFDPAVVRLPGGGEQRRAGYQLVDDCMVRGGVAGATWTLRPDVRRAALASFTGPEHALRTLEANIVSTGIVSTGTNTTEGFELAYLRGQPPQLDELEVDALNHVREAVSWLSLVPGITGLPDPADVRRHLDRRRLVEPLRWLVRHGVAGRDEELDVLRRYAGLLKAPTLRGKIADVGPTLRDRMGRPDVVRPLVVTGTGGIGKSTLIAQFLLTHLESAERPFPLAYVDFESATLRIQEPIRLVGEIARQLAVQYPDHARSFTELRRSTRMIARSQRAQEAELEELHEAPTTWAGLGRQAKYRYHAQTRDEDAGAARRLGELLSDAVRAEHRAPPLLIALDSFEEAQYRASPILDRMWAVFDALTGEYPLVRVVVAGRAPVGHPNVPAEEVRTLELRELSASAAEELLRSRHVAPPVARALVARIGGNPLNLQLAADVAVRMQGHDDTGTWVDEVPAKRRRLDGEVDDMLIRGVLYDRLLNHITDPEIRQLAHPGLALRQVTPAIIQHVLAPVCGVDVPDSTRAHELFDELTRELDLVELVGPDTLRHRPDVRRVMLRLLAVDREDATRAVEQRAVAYYEKSDDLRDRVEELYHRLRLGADEGEIESRWVPEAGPLLEGVADELPKRSARILARLRQGEGAKDEQRVLERRAAREAEDLLSQGFAAEAMAVLEARRPWTAGSLLHPLWVQALLRTGELDQARAAVSEALAEPGVDEYGDIYLELLLLSAQVAVQAGDLAAADGDLAVAERTASRLGRELDALGVQLQRAQLHLTEDDVDEVDASLARRIEEVPEEVLAARPTLFRAVAAEVGTQAPQVLAHAVNLVGLPTQSKHSLAALARAVTEAAAQQPAVAGVLGRLARNDPERWRDASVGDVQAVLDEASSKGRLNQVARELLTIRDDTGTLRAGVAAAMSGELGEQHDD